MKRVARAAVTMAFAVAVLSGGCTKISTSRGPAAGGGNPSTVHGVLRVGSYEDLDNLNPLLSTQAFVTDVDQMIYSGLIGYDDHANPVPDVALAVPDERNGGVSKDGKTITYHLRHNVLFSDGVALTSADVKYTYEQIVNPNINLPYRDPYDDVDSVETPDPYTIIVHLKRPNARFVAAFMRNGNVGSIVPKHLLETISDFNRSAFNGHPVGSGPFMVKRWEPGVMLDLVANPRYWRGPPKLKEVQYRIIPNQNSLLTAIRSHEIDFSYDLPEVQYSILKSLPGYRVTVVPSMTMEHIAFNTRHAPLDDLRVRRAIAYAINWERLAQKVYLGLDRPGMADESPLLWSYDPNVKPYPHDPAQARALLAQAGWRPGPGGVLERNGAPFRISISTVAGVTTREKAEELIQQDLRAVGIALDVRNYPANVLFATYALGGVLNRGHFDLALFAWFYTVPDPDTLTNTIGPTELPPAGQNDTFYVDPDIGRWQHAAQIRYDRAARRPYYWKIQERIHEAVPEHAIVWRSTIDVVNSDLRNFKPAPAVSDFWNSWEWDI